MQSKLEQLHEKMDLTAEGLSAEGFAPAPRLRPASASPRGRALLAAISCLFSWIQLEAASLPARGKACGKGMGGVDEGETALARRPRGGPTP